MTQPRSLTILASALVLAATASGAAQQGATPPVKPRVDAEHRRMQPEEALDFPGTTLNVVGDPEKPGLYVIRRRFKPGEMSRPHVHNQDRLVTVIKGTWWTGEGDVFAPDKTVPIKTGGFMLHPTGLHHYDGAKDEEVIVQIIGMGPVTLTPTEIAAPGK
jgi:oxalate decarboxylase/phosphoglucose isomerase-like protein (cupin superfamily)